MAAGISQEAVGRAIERSDAWVSWTESGGNESVSLVQLSEMLTCVGLELSVRAYPVGGGLRDDGQLEVLRHFGTLVSPPWRWLTEVPIPIPGDLRAWDGVLRGPVSIGVDAETRIRDFQAVDRRVMLKLRDSNLDRAIILVSGSRTNIATVRELGPNLANYPIPGVEALAALVQGRDPGGNAVILLRPGPSRSSPTGISDRSR